MEFAIVVHAEVRGPHVLHLRFRDGTEGDVDFSQRLRFEGVFAPLRDPVEFARVRVDPELHTITWPSGADVDPDVLKAWAEGRELPRELE